MNLSSLQSLPFLKQYTKEKEENRGEKLKNQKLNFSFNVYVCKRKMCYILFLFLMVGFLSLGREKRIYFHPNWHILSLSLFLSVRSIHFYTKSTPKWPTENGMFIIVFWSFRQRSFQTKLNLFRPALSFPLFCFLGGNLDHFPS